MVRAKSGQLGILASNCTPRSGGMNSNATKLRSLRDAREVCEKYHPGLIAALEKTPLTKREGAKSPVVETYREFGGPGLLVPSKYQGPAATALDATRVQRAVGSLSPSLAVASGMHHFTV